MPDSGGGGGGGGRPGGTPKGGSGPVSSFIPFLENGGFAATAYYLFVPTQPSSSGNAYIGVFASTNYNDQGDGSTYFYRQEEIIVGRVHHVRRIILVYRDIGLATITVGVQGPDDNNVVQIASQAITIGSAQATSNLLTATVDLSIACYRPQPFITRAAAAGPVSVISLTLIGEADDSSL
jgi:hypothetical protein